MPTLSYNQRVGRMTIAKHCFVALLVASMLAAGERDERTRQSPNADAFVTAHNFRCKPKVNDNSKPDCSQKQPYPSFLWCETDNNNGWDYCTDDPIKTAHGFTCKYQGADIRVDPSDGFAWCFVENMEGKEMWDHCRYPSHAPPLGITVLNAEEKQEMRMLSEYISKEAEQEDYDKMYADMMNGEDELVDVFETDPEENQLRRQNAKRHSQSENEVRDQSYDHTMDRTFNEMMTLEDKADTTLPAGQTVPWCSFSEAGWKQEDINTAKRQTEEEWDKQEFKDRLFNLIFKASIQCCTDFNNKLYEFVQSDGNKDLMKSPQAKSLEAFNEDLFGVLQPDGSKDIAKLLEAANPAPKTVYFALGPSAAGKTSILATIDALRRIASENINDPKILNDFDLQFPAMTFDGADVREASEVWQRYAKKGGRWVDSSGNGRSWVKADNDRPKTCLLKEYFDKVTKPSLKPQLKKLLFGWIDEYQPPTVLVPETAVPCVTTYFDKLCPVLPFIREFEKRGYKVKFIVIYAPKEKVKELGTSRATKEGKTYSSSGFVLALHSAQQLYKKYRTLHDFIFVLNDFAENKLPVPISWDRFKRFTAAAMLAEASEHIL